MSSPHVRTAPGIASILGALLALAVLLQPVAGHAQHSHGPSMTGGNSTASALAMEAVRPDLRESVAASLPPDLSLYTINVELETERDNLHAVRGSLALSYVNTTGEPLDALPFRLYANGPDKEHDAQSVSDVTIDGETVEAELSVDNSVLTVPFKSPLEPGDGIEIEMRFGATLPVDSGDHYGIFGYDTSSETWALAHWYPVIAGRDPGTGWVLDPPSKHGDPIFSDVAIYDVTVATSASWRVVTSGVAKGEPGATETGGSSQRFVSGPVRDFTLVADADFEVVTTTIEGITVNSWYNPGEDQAGKAVATYGSQSVGLFDEVLSAYPYLEIDFVPVEMQGAAGCEFPGLIYIGADYYDGKLGDRDRLSLEFTVAHEVVHQWFYGLVGNDQYQHAFIDEGITNYLSAEVYFERQYDDAFADEVMESFVIGPYESAKDQGTDPIVDTPTDEFASGYDYVIAAYQKAPLGFQAIRKEIGDEAFFAALQAYVAEWSYRVAEPDDLLAAFEEASGKDLDTLWSDWFEE